MAVIKNEIDKILQATSPRIVNVELPENIVVNASNLSAGVGKNLLPNAGFYLGLDKWTQAGSGTAWLVNLPNWCISDAGALQGTAYVSSLNIDYLYIESPNRMPVIPGQVVEVSAYTGAHRCRVQVYADFWDANGTAMGSGVITSADSLNIGTHDGGTSLSMYKRIYAFHVVPAGAQTARFIIQKSEVTPGETSAYAFVTMPYFGIAGVNQTELSPWSEGIGGQTTQITSSNYQTYMAQGSVTGMAYSNVYGGTQSTINTYLSFNSDSQNVLLHLGVTLTTKVNDSNGGRCNVYYNLYINGTLYRTRNMVHLPNMTTAFAAMVMTTAIVYVPTPPSGSVEYRAEFVPYFDGNGTGGKIENGSIDITGLKR